ncbi:hypothetical protein [Pseudomonas syringae]
MVNTTLFVIGSKKFLNCIPSSDADSAIASGAATKALISASEKLALRYLGAKLPKSIVTAIDWGRSAKVNVGSGAVEVVREEWTSGKGYEIQVIMD